MWLPTFAYERAPHYWLLLGLLLIITSIYLGVETQRSFIFYGVGIGVACCLWSIRIFVRRYNHRPVENHDLDLDQTCELNYDPKQS